MSRPIRGVETTCGYTVNARHWQVGDLVLHSCDAKRRAMLMRVLGYTPEGLCRTVYVEQSLGAEEMHNDLKHLLFPGDFCIETAVEERV